MKPIPDWYTNNATESGIHHWFTIEGRAPHLPLCGMVAYPPGEMKPRHPRVRNIRKCQRCEHLLQKAEEGSMTPPEPADLTPASNIEEAPL